MDDTDFHLGMHDVFVIGKCIDAENDIVYLNFSSLWHLCNMLRNMEAGWLCQLNGDATFNVCCCTVALYSFGVNSLGNVNNPVCWAIIPETESADVLKGLWKAVQDAVILPQYSPLQAVPRYMRMRSMCYGRQSSGEPQH